MLVYSSLHAKTKQTIFPVVPSFTFFFFEKIDAQGLESLSGLGSPSRSTLWDSPSCHMAGPTGSRDSPVNVNQPVNPTVNQRGERRFVGNTKNEKFLKKVDMLTCLANY